MTLSSLPREPRPTCHRCRKPAVACICATLPDRVRNRTPIWVAQHPRERDHPLGTARIARLGLSQVTVEQVRPGAPAPASLPAGAVVLAADPDAPEVAGGEGPPMGALVIVDGTWPHARSLLRRCPWLGALPRVRLQPRETSRYRLRREPAPHCLSTIEAIVEALRRVEPDTPGLDGLLTAFDAMIDRQLALMGPRSVGPRRPTLPRALREARDRWVVVATEVAPRPAKAEEPLLLTHLVAHRPSTGDTWERFGRLPEHRRPHPCHLDDMELTDRDLDEGITPEALQTAWTTFVTPDDVVIAWTDGTLRALRQAGLALPRPRSLKATYRKEIPEARGPLAEQVLRAGLSPVPIDARGRGAHEVGHVCALLEHLSPDDDGP